MYLIEDWIIIDNYPIELEQKKRNWTEYFRKSYYVFLIFTVSIVLYIHYNFNSN